MRHDFGCKFAREADGGHSDAAKRLSDTFNTHKAAGARNGFIAVRLQDATSDMTRYENRSDAVSHQHHNEKWYAFVELSAPSMSVCEAAAMLNFHRQANGFAKPDRDAAGGGLVVIPRLNQEHMRRQFAAMNQALGLPVALGRKA
jgi:hypothetical protein